MDQQDFNKEKTLPDLTSSKEVVIPCPKKIGPYKIENLLNKGGMSFLYLASHPEILRPVVIKVLSPKYLHHKEVVDRFLKEAKRWAEPLQELKVAKYISDIAKDVSSIEDDDISMKTAEKYLMYGILLQNYSLHNFGEK